MANIIQVRISELKTFEVRMNSVGDPVLFKQLLHSWGDSRVTELRHAGEQVVFDLVVQIRHPPVDPECRFEVHRVFSRVAHPVDVFFRFQDGEMRVAHREVGEDISGSYPGVSDVEQDDAANREVGEGQVKQSISEPEVEEFDVFFSSESMTRVKIELPAKSHHQTCQGGEQVSLQG